MSSNVPDSRVGFTTSLPVEVLLAAGLNPTDLNNAFVNGPDPEADIAVAEKSGFPRNICAWIKGIYGTVKRLGIKHVIGVLSGDCSYTEALLDVLSDDGVHVTGFHFPPEPDVSAVRHSVSRLAGMLGVHKEDAESVWEQLVPLRKDLYELDRLTWQKCLVNSEENFQYLINASDFKGNPEQYHTSVRSFLEQVSGREPVRPVFRLGLLGIPPAFTDIHSFLEAHSTMVVYNEMPWEFAMIEPAPGLYRQYCNYTYPYPFKYRLDRIKREITGRRVNGVIHYVQAFCYRAIHDRLLRKYLEVPVLTIEGDRPGTITSRETVRLESFLEMLEENTA